MTGPFSGSCLSAGDIEKGIVRKKRLGAVRSLGGTFGAMYMPGYKGRGEIWQASAPINPGPLTDRTINLQNTCSHSVPETELNPSELREQPKNDFIKKRQDIGCSTLVRRGRGDSASGEQEVIGFTQGGLDRLDDGQEMTARRESEIVISPFGFIYNCKLRHHRVPTGC
jgi:hypothetical protein